jgi:hypothetical protein
MSLKFWDPDQFDLIVGPFVISGYAEGSAIEFEEDGDRFVVVKGLDGQTVRSKVMGKVGTFTVHLLNTSASNDVLSGLHITDIHAAGGAGAVPVALRDKNGATTIACPLGWVMGFPKLTMADKAQDTPWKIQIVDYEMFVAGT